MNFARARSLEGLSAGGSRGARGHHVVHQPNPPALPHPWLELDGPSRTEGALDVQPPRRRGGVPLDEGRARTLQEWQRVPPHQPRQLGGQQSSLVVAPLRVPRRMERHWHEQVPLTRRRGKASAPHSAGELKACDPRKRERKIWPAPVLQAQDPVGDARLGVVERGSRADKAGRGQAAVSTGEAGRHPRRQRAEAACAARLRAGVVSKEAARNDVRGADVRRSRRLVTLGFDDLWVPTNQAATRHQSIHHCTHGGGDATSPSLAEAAGAPQPGASVPS